MILLFKDFSTGYWINNKIVDCGLSGTNKLLHNDLELPDNELIFLEELDVKPENIKKMDIKYKKHKSYNNESKYEKIYIKNNTENIDRNSRKKNSIYKFGGIPSKYKDSDFIINNTQIISK